MDALVQMRMNAMEKNGFVLVDKIINADQSIKYLYEKEYGGKNCANCMLCKEIQVGKTTFYECSEWNVGAYKTLDELVDNRHSDCLPKTIHKEVNDFNPYTFYVNGGYRGRYGSSDVVYHIDNEKRGEYVIAYHSNDPFQILERSENGRKRISDLKIANHEIKQLLKKFTTELNNEWRK